MSAVEIFFRGSKNELGGFWGIRDGMKKIGNGKRGNNGRFGTLRVRPPFRSTSFQLGDGKTTAGQCYQSFPALLQVQGYDLRASTVLGQAIYSPTTMCLRTHAVNATPQSVEGEGTIQ